MTDDLQTGLLLLFVGMITVFTVLGIVVLTGRAIIYILNSTGNKLEGQLTVKASVIKDAPKQPDEPKENKRKLAAAIAAAMVVSKGKGRITSITRANK